MKSSLPPLHSTASVNSDGFIFRIRSESDYFLPSLLLPRWPKPPLSPIWITRSSLQSGLPASTPFFSILLLSQSCYSSTILRVKARDLLWSSSATWHNLLLLALQFIPLQACCFSSSVLFQGLCTYCSLCLECSSSRWSCGLFPYFLQFSSQMQFHQISPPHIK